MIPQSQVNIIKVDCPLELIKQVVNQRERILVLNIDFIEVERINAYSKGTILLLHKQYQSTPWSNTRSNEALSSKYLS